MTNTALTFIHGRMRGSGFYVANTTTGDIARSCVATIGSFDGVHLGHQTLIGQVLQQAQQAKLPSLVIVFEPQPHEFFSKEQAPARLMRLREKVAALYELGVDCVVCLRFNRELMNLPPVDFVKKILVDGLAVKQLVVGDDFRFGRKREGDFTLLKKLSFTLGFKVIDTQTQSANTHFDGNERISSTRIRGLLESDHFEQAQSLLGKPFAVAGRVIYGKQLGRSIGFPTANIGLGRYRSPVHGVFCVLLKTPMGVFNSVANVGVRPTVGGRKKPILEVHVLNDGGISANSLNLYGTCVTAEFKKKIRDEKKFDSLIDLQRQIKIDVEAAEHFFTTAQSDI